jgi:hypothetical protein
MLTRVLLLFIVLNAISTNNCFSMELKNTASINNDSDASDKKNTTLQKDKDPIPLNDGLLTEIPGKITETSWKFDHFFSSGKKVTEFHQKNDTLINLWSYRISASEGGWQKYFAPLIIKVTSQTPKKLVLLGTLDKKSHREAKKAIDKEKALYWPYEQGVVIYSIKEQPNTNITKYVKQLLDNRTYEMTIPEQ